MISISIYIYIYIVNIYSIQLKSIGIALFTIQSLQSKAALQEIKILQYMYIL